MKPHETMPGWLVDDRGRIWRRERRFTCPNHPYGPPDLDELPAEFVRFVELAEKIGVHDATDALADAYAEIAVTLGRCCKGHRWRFTGRIVEVSPLEVFFRENLPRLHADLADSIAGSILLQELNADRGDRAGQKVVIPLIRPVGDTPDGGERDG